MSYDSSDDDSDFITCGTNDDDLSLEVVGGQPLGVEARGRGAFRGRGLKWEIGQEIYVKFLNGPASYHRKVERIAKIWEKYANITFTFVTSGYSDIRISFDTTKGWWSLIGTRALSCSIHKPTMNLAVEPYTPYEKLRGVVLHEFGHALGLQHEHQSPTFPIRWNEEKVYAEYAKMGWSRRDIRNNVLRKANATQYTRFDPKSIMLYPIQKRLTTNGWGIKSSETLSKTDKDFIEKLYPFPESDSDGDGDSDSE